MGWRYKINLKKHLSADESQEAMRVSAAGIRKEIESLTIGMLPGIQNILLDMDTATNLNKLR